MKHASKAVSGGYSSAGVLTANQGISPVAPPGGRSRVTECHYKNWYSSYPTLEASNSNQCIQSHRHSFLSLTTGIPQM